MTILIVHRQPTLFPAEYHSVTNFIPELPTLLLGYQLYYLSTSLLARARCSLHGDAFGEVAGLIDVAAPEDGDVVGEELQRDGGEEGV